VGIAGPRGEIGSSRISPSPLYWRCIRVCRRYLAAILSQGGDELQGGVLVVFYGVAVAFLVVGIAGLAIGISMSRSITGAVHALYAGTQRVMRGEFSQLIQVSGRDQLAELAALSTP